MIRNIFLTAILVLGLHIYVAAQVDNRTRETKIADIVMLLPADNTAKFNSLMSDLYSLGDVVNYLAQRLTDSGGNDAQIRYAINGLTVFASKTAERKAGIERYLIKATLDAQSDEIRDFLLIQLQYVAGRNSVETVSGYLSNDRLCDAAARVLVRIGGEEAGKALLNALNDAKTQQQITIVQALGDIACEPAVTNITALSSSSNRALKKVALYALAQIASPDSEKVLSDEVSKVNCRQESTDALGSYILYLENRLMKQSQKQVAAAAKKLLKATSDDKQIAAKTAALRLYVAAEGGKALPEILNALNSDNKQYRVAALNCASMIKSPKTFDALVARLGKEKNVEIKSEIIYSLGDYGGRNVFPVSEKYLTDDNDPVKQAAIVVAGQTGDENAIVPILTAMNTGGEETVAIGKSVLLSIGSDRLIPEVVAALPKARPAVKIALLDILSSHRATLWFDLVYEQATSSDENVRTAAYKALKNIATAEVAPLVAQLLNISSNSEHTVYLQDALYASISSLPQNEQYRRVVGLLKTSRNPVLYYNVLAKIGGNEALKIVLSGMDGADSDAAFEALTEWNDASSTPVLFDIAKANTKYSNKALESYIAKIKSSASEPEQKLLLLRNALDVAKTDAQKQSIIREIAATGSFLGLITAGRYLDDKNVGVQQAAVRAVRKIAVANPDYYGNEVSALLNKAIAVNKDPEAEYQKQEILKHLSSLPTDEGFVSLFNGKDLAGWKGLVEDPVKRGKMTAKQLAAKQKAADVVMRRDWRVENGLLVFDGKGYDNLCSVKDYADFEMYVDWKIAPQGDAGIYLRGTPQVQIWDISRVSDGAQVGSGGLYNNQTNESKPLVVADNAVNEWNSFYIRMTGDRVTVYLNGQMVTDDVVLENYWDRSIPVFPTGQIELQAHGTRVEYRDIYVREIPRREPYKVSDAEKAEGFVPLFNGVDMSGWIGNLKDYIVRDGSIACVPSGEGHGNLYSEKEYSNFVLRFEFKLTPAANNGLGIRTPLEGDAAYVGMELQILDNEADVYKDLAPYQYHGSVYGVIPARRGFLKPTGEWNTQEVVARGTRIKVTLNGTVIVDGDIAEASKNFTATADKQKHPGLSNKKGYIGFLGHGSELEFRNLRIKEL